MSENTTDKDEQQAPERFWIAPQKNGRFTDTFRVSQYSAFDGATEYIRADLARSRASLAAVEEDERCEVSYTGRHRIDAPYCKDCGQVFTLPAASSSPLPAEPQDDGWVTFGRVKVDIENETETFERIATHYFVPTETPDKCGVEGCNLNALAHPETPKHNAPAEGEQVCKCGLPKNDPIHSYTTERQQMHAFTPKNATPAEPEGEQLARQIVGTVFDNSSASHETLKRTMIERIADRLAATPPKTPVVARETCANCESLYQPYVLTCDKCGATAFDCCLGAACKKCGQSLSK